MNRRDFCAGLAMIPLLGFAAKAKSDHVPAMVMPGEFVINKKAISNQMLDEDLIFHLKRRYPNAQILFDVKVKEHPVYSSGKFLQNKKFVSFIEEKQDILDSVYMVQIPLNPYKVNALRDIIKDIDKCRKYQAIDAKRYGYDKEYITIVINRDFLHGKYDIGMMISPYPVRLV